MQNYAPPPITDLLAQNLRQALSVALDTPVALVVETLRLMLSQGLRATHLIPDEFAPTTGAGRC